jgi:general stress protein 26
MIPDDHDIERFEDVLQRFDHAMLVSVAEDGSLHARPMAIAERDGPMLRFATSNKSAKAAEITMRPGVAVVMQGSGAYLAISGTARLVEDRDRNRLLWQAAWQAWFPDGPDDPSLVLIEVDPERAEYWDRTGARRLEFLWEAGKAIATGRRLTEAQLSGHGKFTFG